MTLFIYSSICFCSVNGPQCSGQKVYKESGSPQSHIPPETFKNLTSWFLCKSFDLK